jgi:tetratricopeptide (TPR) repeat protein
MQSHVCALALALLHVCVPARGSDGVALMQQAQKLYLSGRVAEAQKMYEQLSARETDHTFTGDHLAVTLNNLALLYGNSGRTSEAERVFRRGFDAAETPAIRCHVAIQFANHYLNGSKPSQAERLPLAECRDQARDAEQKARAESVLASIVAGQRRFSEAEDSMRRLLEFWRARPRALAADEETAALLNNLGNLLLDAGRLEEATVHLTDAVQALERLYGPRHQQAARARYNLGCLHAKQGNHGRAVEELRSALATYGATLGERHPETNRARLAYAVALKRAGRGKEARRIQNDIEEARREAGPSASELTVDYRELMTLRNQN